MFLRLGLQHNKANLRAAYRRGLGMVVWLLWLLSYDSFAYVHFSRTVSATFRQILLRRRRRPRRPPTGECVREF
jgi:hypothetical protein